MRFFQRSLLAMGLAAATPALVFIAVQILFSLQAKRHELDALSQARAKQVQQSVDARLESELGQLRILATSSFLAERNWTEFYTRIKRAQLAASEWTGVVLEDANTGALIFDTRRPLTAEVSRGNNDSFAQTVTFGKPTISGIVATAPGTLPSVYVHLPVSIGEGQAYTLTAAVDPQVFQDILTSIVPATNLSTVVDGDGNYVARNLRYPELLGMSATHYVRDVIAGGREGVYFGISREGAKNYAAFYKSPWSGWSTHVGVAAATMDVLSWWSFAVAGMAALATIALTSLFIALVMRNMAELRKTEEAARQSQKMEAVGRLTAGIAHDFNNLLTAIIGNLDLIRNRTAGNQRAQTLTAHALEAARRAEKLTSRLLAFSREQRLALKPVNLSDLLPGMSDLLLKSLGPHITLRTDVDPAASTVVSDASQLELALINLAVNARDAMPRGGKFTITTRLESTPGPGGPLEFVELAVSDTGVGMSEAVRARALEPFFTTKPAGQGTGLGLSQVFAFARASGGSVSIESEPGAGATIRILLPAATERYPKTIPEPSPATVRLTGSEPQATILVVDDDNQVRRYVVDSLRDFRYRVIDAATGADALERLRTEPVDLLVVDFAMPGMNGAEVACAARAIRPNMRVLMISGYADSAAVEAAIGPRRLLRKPFNVGELSAAVAKVLQDQPID
jgi:signal transduction histidine kinase